MSTISLHRRVTLTRTVRWLLAATAVATGVLVWAAVAWARPPHGRYDCFYYYRTGGMFFMGSLFIDGPSTYHYTGAGHGKGTYTLSHNRLRFHGGPLKHEFGLVSRKPKFWEITLQTRPGINGYASTCDGPAKK
jgi:hypothetical protein